MAETGPSQRPDRCRGPRLVLFTLACLGKSARVLGRVARDASFCIVASGLTLLCCSMGNVFSRRPMAEQSYATFLTGIMTYVNALFSFMKCILQALWLRRCRRLGDGGMQRKMGFWRCLVRIVAATCVPALLLFGVILGVIYSVDDLAGGQGNNLHLDFYASAITGPFIMAYVDFVSRRIYTTETVEGRDKLRKWSLVALASKTHPRHRPRPLSPVDLRAGLRRTASLRYYLRLYRAYVPSTATQVLAGLFVQVVSRHPFTSQRGLTLFTLGCLGLKFATQHVIKTALLRHNVRDARLMFISVGFPSVLIDTQVRAMVQLGQTVTMNVAWSLALAATEVLVRSKKVFLLRRRMLQQQRLGSERNHTIHAEPVAATALSRVPPPLSYSRRVAPLDESTPPRSAPSTTSSSTTSEFRRRDRLSSTSPAWFDGVVVASGPQGRKPSSSLPGDERRRRWLRLHATEAYADMAAEYIAITCSTMIVYMLSNHPKYRTTGAALPSPWHQLRMMGLQILLEVGVDSIATALEVAHGVDFEALKRYETFISVMFVGIGLMNIQISAVMHINTDD